MAQALGDGLQRAKQRLADVGGPARDVLALASAMATKPERPEVERVAAIRLLAHRTYGEAGELLFGLLDQKEPQPVQLAALSTLARFTEAQVGLKLTGLWSSFTPRLQAEALPVLLARPERAEAFLKAIETGSIRANVLDTTQTKLLQTYRDPKVRQLAATLLATATTSSKQQIIDGYAASLTMNGDVARGRKIYQERCLSCHRAGGEGFVLGPDLVTVKTTGKEKLLTNIVDPNREVRPEFAAFTVETKDDESYVGLVVNQSAAAVTLQQAFGKEDVIPRANIAKMHSQGLSIMP
jgi:putative heme-binding domain-containing protein